MDATKRVLVVDDSTTAARQLQQLIRGLPGHQVVAHARNGAEALKLYQELSPDIVCMDIVMPVMDGLTTLRSLLRLDASARVVVISSVGGSRNNIKEALRLGAKNVIAKPFDEAEVLSVLRDVSPR